MAKHAFNPGCSSRTDSVMNANGIATLCDAHTVAVVSADAGGSILSWQDRRGQPLLYVQPMPEHIAADQRKPAMFPMAPWCNRIGSGGFDVTGRWMPLAPNRPGTPWPIHGTAWQQCWNISHSATNRVRLELQSEVPWRYAALQDIALNHGCLSVSLQVTHHDAEPVWYGMGLHPYFPRDADTRLQVHSHGVWTASDAGPLPDTLQRTPERWQFDNARALPEDRVDHAFAGWDGHARIEQPSRNHVLTCTATGYDYFHLYCPQQQPFFCLEPVTHPVNAHHLPGRPGLQLLQQGQSLTCLWEMKLQI